jgi:hypothetical protein
MGILVPVKDPFATLIHNGTESETAAGKKLALGASGYMRSQWVDIGAGNTLAKVSISTTATGTVYGRSSSARPTGGYELEDNCPVLPASWTYTYDPGLGTYPASQGWTASGGGTATLTGGLLRLQPGASTTACRFSYDASAFSASKSLSIAQWRNKFSATYSNSGRIQGVLFKPPGTNNYIGLQNSHDGLIVIGSVSGSSTYTATRPVLATNTLHDFLLIGRASAGTYSRWTLWYRVAGSRSQDDLDGYIQAVSWAECTTAGSQFAYWGNAFNGSATDSDFYWEKVRFWSGDEVTALTDGQTSFSVNNGRYWQIYSDSLVSGDVTLVGLHESTSAPSTPGNPRATVTANGDIIADLASAAANAASYKWEMHDGSSIVQTKYGTELTVSFPDPGNGTYTVRCTAVRSNGIVSASYGTSAAAVLPYTAPSVAVTVAAATVAPGGTVAASAVIAGGATATLGGSGWDGSSQTIVTGVAGGGINPPGAFTVAMSNAPGAYSITYSGGTMRIYLGSAGDATRDTATLEKSTDGLTSWATDATQGTNPVNYSALTFNGASVGVSYATDHGWSLTTGTYYRVKLTDVDGRSTYSNALRWAAQSDYECVVSGSLPSPWRDGTKTVTVKLSEAVAIGSQTYATGPYTATVGTDGAWSVTLPRLASATQVDGGSNALSARFTFPDGTKVSKAIPNSASATFESLTAV